jgi:hypothetical protein
MTQNNHPTINGNGNSAGVPPAPPEAHLQANKPKFKINDKVIYTNPQGVCWGEKTIVGYELWTGETYTAHRYYISPTDTPWYPVHEDGLRHIELVQS